MKVTEPTITAKIRKSVYKSLRTYERMLIKAKLLEGQSISLTIKYLLDKALIAPK